MTRRGLFTRFVEACCCVPVVALRWIVAPPRARSKAEIRAKYTALAEERLRIFRMLPAGEERESKDLWLRWAQTELKWLLEVGEVEGRRGQKRLRVLLAENIAAPDARYLLVDGRARERWVIENQIAVGAWALEGADWPHYMPAPEKP